MLTALQVEHTKPGSKPVRLYDGRGLYLEIAPTGGRGWRFRYFVARRERRMSLGPYPEVSLKEAREKREELRKQVAAGTDPGEIRQLTKLALVNNSGNTFEAIAREWHQMHSGAWNPEYRATVIRRLEADAFPWIGSQPINSLKPLNVLAVLRRIQKRGALETAHRMLQYASKIMRHAVATGRADRDITADLRGALPPVKGKHHAALVEPKAVGALMRAIDEYQGYFLTRCALRLSALLFVRQGELRKAEWSEIDFENCEWRIPAERMKMKTRHIVPLSRQAMEIFRELHAKTGRLQHVFPGLVNRKRPMSENAVNSALRRMGYVKGEMTAHGFRSMASTLLNEQGWNSDAIERQLAHAERDSVRAAYNHAEHLAERRKMMQAWADYLDKLAGESVPVSTQPMYMSQGV